MGLKISKLGPKISPEQCRQLTRAVCTRLTHTLQKEGSFILQKKILIFPGY